MIGSATWSGSQEARGRLRVGTRGRGAPVGGTAGRRGTGRGGFLALLLAASLPAGAALAAPRMVELEMTCPVTEATPMEADGSLKVVIGRGHDDGLTPGTSGFLWENRKPGGWTLVRRGAVVAAEAGTARVRLEPMPGSVPRPVSAGTDTIFILRILAPEEVRRGLLLDTYLAGIDFLDNVRAPFASLREMLAARDGRLEERVWAAMVQAGHEVAEFTVDLKTPISHGKWKGKVMKEVLEGASPEDYQAFLRFVRDYPGKYLGKKWKTKPVLRPGS